MGGMTLQSLSLRMRPDWISTAAGRTPWGVTTRVERKAQTGFWLAKVMVVRLLVYAILTVLRRCPWVLSAP
uniref:Uncharacterized protein n=1 Tax=mine drainage metagenome TaxID=410659 RepID=E6QLB4_9ZZZZ